MKEVAERTIAIRVYEQDEASIAAKLEAVAEEMAKDGWFFLESKCDAVMENVTLFFEREIPE